MSFPNFLAHQRIFISRILVAVAGLSLIFTHHSWPEHEVMDIAVEVVGYILIVAATFLRLWCCIYLYGYKGRTLVDEGPYSVVRNPLYVASLIGAVGLGFMSENIIFFVLIVFFFLVYYPFVVINEERELSAALGEEYKKYQARVPRFIPNFSLFHEPEHYEIYPKRVKRAFLDAMWFLWAVIGLEGLELLRVLEILPVLVYVP